MHTEELLLTEPAARRAGYGPRTFEGLRAQGKGPAFIRFGRKVLYRPRDIDEWLNSHRVEPEAARRAQ